MFLFLVWRSKPVCTCTWKEVRSNRAPAQCPPAPTTPQALEHHLLYGTLRAAHYPLPTPTRVDSIHTLIAANLPVSCLGLSSLPKTLSPEHFGILAYWFGCVLVVTIMRPPGLLCPLIHSNPRLLVRTQPRSQSFSLGCLVSRAPTR